jgi:p21-activated kinase 1
VGIGSAGTKGRKRMLGFMPSFLNLSKWVEISTMYDPVDPTHVGFNSSTDEFTGLPKEWQQLLPDSGISSFDEEKNPPVVMEIVKFYQEGHGDRWDKIGFGVGASEPAPNKFASPVRTYVSILPYIIDVRLQRPLPPPAPVKKPTQLSPSPLASPAPAAYRPASAAPPVPTT